MGDTWWTYKLKNSELDVHCVWKDVDSCELAIILSLKINFMAEVGYSGTPLIKKLGIKPEMKILVIHESGNYFDLLGVNISDQFVLKNEVPDLVHLFAKNMAVFTKKMKAVLKLSKQNPAVIVWVSWYKKAQGSVPIFLKISSGNLPCKITWLM